MKIINICCECAEIHNKTSFFNTSLDINDSGIYDIKCPEGHEYTLCVQNNHYEVLFDSGCLALLDGYNLESVSSITAAFERLLEFIIKFLLFKSNVSPNHIDETWKRQFKGSSERQFGAFNMLFLQEYKILPPTVDNYKKYQEGRKFRNKLLHNGYFPTQEEAHSYASSIFSYIKELTEEIKERDFEALNKFISYQVTQRSESLKGKKLSGGLWGTIFNLSRGEQYDSLEEGLKELSLYHSLRFAKI